jgi:spore photoproduct lyase
LTNIKDQKLKIHYNAYFLLNGKRGELVKKVNDGSIITRFDKTPFPQKQTDVVCPHFLELKWAYGCPFDCAWCYLKGTFRFRPEGPRPAFKPFEKIQSHVEVFLNEVDTPEILNTGEIADSLMGENGDSPFSKFIIPLFKEQSRHRVLFVTKSTNIKHLLEIPASDQVVMSFSLNAEEIAKKWEKKAPPVKERLKAAQKLHQHGYEVRIRIDPMVPAENWESLYTVLIDLVFNSLIPERITLGSLRGLQSTINGSKDASWVKYLKERSNWGKKIEFDVRYWMYLTIINHLKEKYSYTKVALCKETKLMWEKLDMDYRKIHCNCVW